ncbi:MAG: methyltransferase domain-containing protein [Solirubrobacteraceae bacterium]
MSLAGEHPEPTGEHPEPTGERFIPELMSGELIDAEHQTRYRFSLPHVRGCRVLDAGCGVGWGSALLVEAGASEVVGVDLDPEAVEDARRRVPAATFAVGDLMDLPFDDDSFDVVVCFEAIEHTGDTERTLDQLDRVLRPNGLLFVSSPNPDVYPPGNPFHLNEETPAELLRKAAGRFAQVRLFRQHVLIASVLCADRLGDRATAIAPGVEAVTPLVPGHDPYSVVVAGNGELPAVAPMSVLAPSTQLDNITTLADELGQEIKRLNGELARLREDHDKLGRDASAYRAEAGTERAGLVAEIERLRVAGAEDLAELRTSRDRYAAMILTGEQELDAARRERDQWRGDYRVIAYSRSWRLTKPLRDARRRLPQPAVATLRRARRIARSLKARWRR